MPAREAILRGGPAVIAGALVAFGAGFGILSRAGHERSRLESELAALRQECANLERAADRNLPDADAGPAGTQALRGRLAACAPATADLAWAQAQLAAGTGAHLRISRLAEVTAECDETLPPTLASGGLGTYETVAGGEATRDALVRGLQALEAQNRMGWVRWLDVQPNPAGGDCRFTMNFEWLRAGAPPPTGAAAP